jgi:hypothetical protein
MDDAPITTEMATDVADTHPPTTDAEMTSTMATVYDSHHAEESEPSGYVEHGPDSTETYEQPVETPQSPTGLPMPRSWSASQASVWNSLSPEAQAYVAKRDDEQHRKITELGRKAAESTGEVGQIYEEFRSRGQIPLGEDGREISATQVVRSALDFDQALRQSPAAVIQALAQAHGVKLVEPGAQGPHVDLEQWQRAYGEVAQQLERIKADHAGWQQQTAHQQQQAYDARVQWLAGELNSYFADKPHWPQIENEVIAQVQALLSQNPARTSDPMGLLRDAEKRAMKITGIDPDAKTKQAAAAAEQKRKADEARRLASLNAKSRSGRSPSETRDIWDTMANTYDRINGGR